MEVAMITCGKALSPPLPYCFSPSTSSDPAASASSPSSTTTAPPASAPPPPAAVGGATTPQQVVLSPCAACKILRRRCVDKCVLAPYFPPTDPLKFTVAHRVFGASNIIKLLQELPESQRADAVSSMVYEANARLRDPVYGSAGAICHLQKQVSELQAELAKAQAELDNMKCQQANLLAMLCMKMTGSNPINPTNPTDCSRHHLPMISSPSSPLQGDDDHSQLNGPFSGGFLNFYDDDSNCSLSWELL